MKEPPQMLQRQADGSWIDWGRNVTVNGVSGEGGARLYTGESARVWDLLLLRKEK